MDELSVTVEGVQLRAIGTSASQRAGFFDAALRGLAELQQADLDFVLLPDEPYEFTPDDGPEAFPGTRSVPVSGRLLTWYGPSLVTAHEELATALFGD